ncbi:helix-turn-helix transcriptional regulator [Gordonia desulfuricans]|uniref:Helix-turn-helix transcriptional regulator n=1 Tax=Gordonia desulfuricans TaxID=89051 RepID=A0A7K3LM55_9ACTN|nr:MULTISPECIES: XRE family transcriptional regulator [Gordonia]KOY49759.1 DNA-binding protein [Gordonia sp. NB41Y]NDK89330.1 helix-turn-helix transcriptional regulator [Gordonia desulfuricans]WLP91835.1 XRE family transcriptional regulator [Gordonia sp. NB41Y]
MTGVRQDGRSSGEPDDPAVRTDPRQQLDPKQLVAAGLRRERARAGLSLGELARRAGVGKSTLSQLESGVGNPSVETMWALSTALGIQFSALLDAPEPRVEVIRAGEGPVIAAADADYLTTLLSSARPGSRRDLYLIRAEPDSPRRSLPHARGIVEHVVLSAGRALVGPVDDPVELAPGDYICYPGDLPHIFDAQESGTVAVLISEAF